METYFPRRGGVYQKRKCKILIIDFFPENATALLMSTPIAEYNFKQRASVFSFE
jgi:hypothetical protein